MVAQRELDDAQTAGVPAVLGARPGRLASFLWTVSAVLLLGEVVLAILNRDTDLPASSGPVVDSLVRLAVLALATVGALVAARRPENAIGWILIGAAVVFAFDGFVFGWATYTLETSPGSLPGGELIAWLAEWLFYVPLFAMPAFLFLLFPSGRYLTARWRVVTWLTGATTLIIVLGAAIAPGRLNEPCCKSVANPLGIEGAETLLDVLGPIGYLGVVASIAAAAVSMVLRLRRSTGVERLQLKWVAAAAGVFALACVGAVVAFALGEDGWAQSAVQVGYVGIPIAAGYAILRHRLYNVDLVVNRALVYGSLTALLAGVYFGFVLLFQLALSPVTEGNELAVAVSTLAVAALFRPVRRRIQALVDRRFYRRKYDAERTLTGFATRLRDEVDLESLRRELTGVVGETMQPRHVSLWLRTPEARA